MDLFLSMLPIYILGNFHCMGMCGPLVSMIGKHRFRYFYFLGRALSFSLAGFLAGEMGAVLHFFLKKYHISVASSILFGVIISLIGFYILLGWNYPGHKWLARKLSRFNNSLSLLILRDRIWPTFLFGFFTVTLPCGQTLIVFSACALYGDGLTGFSNGLIFALFTTPSLYLAMHAHLLIRRLKNYYQPMMGVSALIVGLISIFRGIAELEIIPHLILFNHFVIY